MNFVDEPFAGICGFCSTYSIRQWLVLDGASVKRGDMIAEVENDKCIAEWPAAYDGIIHILQAPGIPVPEYTAAARYQLGDADWQIYQQRSSRFSVDFQLTIGQLAILDANRGDASRQQFIQQVLIHLLARRRT